MSALSGNALAHDYGWTDPRTLTATTQSPTGQSTISEYPEIAGDGQRLVIVWQDFSEYDQFTVEDIEVFATHSSDAGESWSAPVNLSDSNELDHAPDVAFADGVAVAAWRLSSPTGRTAIFEDGNWRDGGSFGDEESPIEGAIEVVSDGSNFYILSSRSGDGRIWRSVDGGESWTPLEDALSANAYDANSRLIATTDSLGLLYPAGFGENQKPDYFFRTSTNEGETWSSPSQVSATPYRETWGQIAEVGSRLVVAWHVQTSDGGGRVEAVTSSDGGDSWNSPVTVAETSGAYYFGLQTVLVGTQGGFEVFIPTMTGMTRYVSPDGVTWTPALAPVVGETFSGLSVLAHGDSRHLVTTTRGEGDQAASYAVYTRGGPDVPTGVVIKLRKTLKSELVVLKGATDPPEAGIPLTATVFRRQSGVFRLIERHRLRSGPDGRFVARIPVRPGGRCRIDVKFSGDAAHRSSSATTEAFTCPR